MSLSGAMKNSRLRLPSCISGVALVALTLLSTAAVAAASPLQGQSALSLPTEPQVSAPFSAQPLVVFSQPPAGFDPTTATSAQLQAHGFPPRPPAADSANEAGWLQAMENAKHFEAPNPQWSTVVHDGPWYSSNRAGHVAPNEDYGDEHFTW